jgi:hypothetical protein
VQTDDAPNGRTPHTRRNGPQVWGPATLWAASGTV